MTLSLLDIDRLEVIAPNFKRRLSGVTSTIVQLVPVQRALGFEIAVIGPGLPAHLPHLRVRDLWQLWRRQASGKFRVWHARRNVEMLPGIIMRDVLRMPLKLVFTSASQRKHTAYTKFLVSRMDHVIATSAKTAAYLTVPHTVVMHGIDLDRFCPPSDKESAKRTVGLPDNKKIAGCFGRIRHQKGTDIFVHAMLDLLQHNLDWIAIIAGRTTAEHAGFERELRERIAAAGLVDRILFVGEHKDIERWYQALDLFIAPQRWEGFGLTPLEAMACGVPVVATDVGVFSELVVEGETGIVTQAGDLAALISAIELFLKDLALSARAGKSARAHVEQNYLLEGEAAALNSVYRKLMQ